MEDQNIDLGNSIKKMKNKKAILAVVISIIIFVAGYFSYNFFFKDKSSENQVSQSSNEVNETENSISNDSSNANVNEQQSSSQSQVTNDQLESDLNGLDKDFKTFDDEVNGVDSGLSDQQTNLN